MSTIAERLIEARTKAGYNKAAPAARAIGVNYQTYIGHEDGSRIPKAEFLQRYASTFGVTTSWLLSGKDMGENNQQATAPLHSIRVEGVSHAGRFEDISLIADDEFSREVLAAPRDDRFPHAHQYALKVSGDSMNLRYPDDGYVICAAWNDTGLELRDGHAVHVERIRFASERETTIKIYKEIDDKRWLYPDSTNKNHQPIEINGETDIEIIIKGIILATYSKEVI